ncbi:MAG: flavodoxin family protein, partial [Planctomycetota bacterium]
SAKMLDVDRLIFATPVFFMTVSAHAKLLIDRCQSLWSLKYILKKPVIESSGRDRRAMVIAVGGTRGKKMFGCIHLTMKYYFDVLEMNYSTNLFVSNVDALGEIKKHPSALKDAFRLGRELITTTAPPPQKPLDIELK